MTAVAVADASMRELHMLQTRCVEFNFEMTRLDKEVDVVKRLCAEVARLGREV